MSSAMSTVKIRMPGNQRSNSSGIVSAVSLNQCDKARNKVPLRQNIGKNVAKRNRKLLVIANTMQSRIV